MSRRTATRTLPAPPPAAERWLRRALPPGTVAASILGDLQQEFEEGVAAGRHLRARLQYWRATLELLRRYAFRTRRLRRFGQSRRSVRFASPLPETPPEGLMASLLNDLRYSLRQLVRSPLQSTIAVLTIALGVALTVHTFSQVYGASIRGLPVPDAHEVVGLRELRGSGGMFNRSSIPLHDYLDYREAISLAGLAAYYQGTANLAGDDVPPERYSGLFGTANLLDVVGVRPALGRTLRPEEDRPGRSPVVVIGHALWQNRFAGDPGVVGRSVRLNGQQAEIVGVMPEGFRFPFQEELWTNARFDPDASKRREGVYVDAVGRIAAGATVAAAQAELEAISARIAERYPDLHEGVTPTLMPFTEMYMPAEINAAMFTMLAAVMGVLLIACANVANLLLARATERGREMAVRNALGASRARVIRLMMVETLVLAAVGGLLGLGAAKLGLDAYGRYLEPIEKPYWIDIRLDGPALLFTVGVVVATALLAGIVPALRATGAGAGAILKDESRGASSLRLGRFSKILVVGEIAVSAALLVTAGLMVKSVINVTGAELGFDPDGIVSARVGLFETDYPERADREQFFNDLIARIRQEPGVESATLATSLPGGESDQWAIGVEGVAYATDVDYPRVSGAIVDTEYFSTFGVRLLQGREFLTSESGAGAEPAVIINESFARRYLPQGDPIGRRLRLGRSQSTNPWMRVVGVVPDLHVAGGVGGIGSDQFPREHLYVARGVFDVRFLTIAVRSARDVEMIVPGLRAAVASLDANLPIYDVMSARQMMEQYTWAFEMFGGLFSMLGGAALFLAAVGLYGVMAFSVSRRTHELGIRMALGAQAHGILGLVVRGALWQLAIGLLGGLALGAALSQPLAVLTYGVRPGDPAIFLAITVTLLATGLLATLIPARRALSVDPAVALRAE